MRESLSHTLHFGGEPVLLQVRRCRVRIRLRWLRPLAALCDPFNQSVTYR